jgi:hypothetical protein
VLLESHTNGPPCLQNAEIISGAGIGHARHGRRTCSPVRIEPQISPIAQQALRLVADECVIPAVRHAKAACEQRVVRPDHCDRYEPCADAPGSLLYADYLERQNRRRPLNEQPEPSVKPDAQPCRPKPETPPVDSGLGPKLGDIPAPDHAQRTHQRVQTAYQVQRHTPAGSLIDVVL